MSFQSIIVEILKLQHPYTIYKVSYNNSQLRKVMSQMLWVAMQVVAKYRACSNHTASQQPSAHLHASPHLHCPLPGLVPREEEEEELKEATCATYASLYQTLNSAHNRAPLHVDRQHAYRMSHDCHMTTYILDIARTAVSTTVSRAFAQSRSTGAVCCSTRDGTRGIWGTHYMFMTVSIHIHWGLSWIE